MRKADIEQILDQVEIRYASAWDKCRAGRLDEADKELSELRDVLDDVYDRTCEEITGPASDQSKGEDQTL